MIQRKFIELNRKGDWVLYRVAYYYHNKPCWYYELHKENPEKNVDDVIKFGQKKFDDLKKMMTELSKETLDISHVSVINDEKIVIDPTV
jgi:hypothetical protein